MPRQRRSARAIIVGPNQLTLLARFVEAGNDGIKEYWATIGGELEDDETWADALVREIKEEIGDVHPDVGPLVAIREKIVRVPSEEFLTYEHYFRVDLPALHIDMSGVTAHERLVMPEVAWHHPDDLDTIGVIYPENYSALYQLVLQGDVARDTFPLRLT